FSDRYNSANCGWVRLENSTLLIDLPAGVSISDFVTEVEAATGKPPGAFVLTRPEARDDPGAAGLRNRGIREIPTPTERSSIGDAKTPIELIPYRNPNGQAAVAVSIPGAGVLFAGPAAVNGPRLKLEGSDVSAWIGTLKELQKTPATQVVPGFGSWGSVAMLE